VNETLAIQTLAFHPWLGPAVGAFLVITATVLTVAIYVIKRRNMDNWLRTYMSRKVKPLRPWEPVHLLLCIADHYEPQHGKPPAEKAMARVDRWVTEYPRLFSEFRDTDGRPPRHSFFFPIDEYEAAHVDKIAGLCRAGFGELEIHLHHDRDTAEGLSRRLDEFVRIFRDKHGVLPVDKNGRVKFGFIHGNWALDNARPDGRWCGVNNELDVLREAGCYADFTLPSAPSPTQTRKINSIYYATDHPTCPKSHDWGVDVGSTNGKGPPENALLLIQGPLVLNWQQRKAGVMPRVENGCLQSGQSPNMRRLDLWLHARVQVPSRPDWFFVKLHTHGAPESNQAVVLGEPMARFHRALAERAKSDANFHYHYVTAREMYNLVKAAEAGFTGSVAEARDFELVWKP
jgi:hypothetical protein